MILVAEDEESLRGMLALVLRSAGYEVLLCSDGSEARITLAGDDHIDAALLDLRMPALDGTKVIEYVRGNPQRASLPVIAMSAFSDEFNARHMLAAGADAFLAKPFTIQELTSVVAQALSGRAPAAS